jgi:ABC-type branched-subunit amino acid transport system substrate-binding protein
VAEAHGVKVLDILYHPRDAVDFTSMAVKAKSYNPDLVDYPGAVSGTQFGLEMKAVYGAGFRGGQISAIAPKMDEVTAVAGNEALEGLLCRQYQTDLPEPPPLPKKFKDDYVRKYGKWSDACFPWIPAWQALLAAIKKADNVDPTGISDMMASKGLEWGRIDGRAMMVKRPDLNNTKYVDSVAEVQYGQIKNGKIVAVGGLSPDEVVAACEKVFGGNWK